MPSTLQVEQFIAELKEQRDELPFTPYMEADDLDVSTTDILPITREVYWFRMELLPPRYMARNYFAYGAGGNPLHLFYEQGDEHYVLLMTAEESEIFQNLVGLRRTT